MRPPSRPPPSLAVGTRAQGLGTNLLLPHSTLSRFLPGFPQAPDLSSPPLPSETLTCSGIISLGTPAVLQVGFLVPDLPMPLFTLWLQPHGSPWRSTGAHDDHLPPRPDVQPVSRHADVLPLPPGELWGESFHPPLPPSLHVSRLLLNQTTMPGTSFALTSCSRLLLPPAVVLALLPSSSHRCHEAFPDHPAQR